ncbi:SDR family NAD(P)-dependent oxidoreductase [Paremcibacter congregatus]|uniref:SDR family NAD(P)-dependent oxidoreductase n=1 Tax=Paremcibacter congregatus TaxID=2043170 RepID=UPI003A91E3F7
MAMKIWITGGRSGLGYALVQAYLRAGCHVFATARDEIKLSALEKECHDLPGRLVTASVDVCDQAAIRCFYADLLARDIVLNRVILNAGTHIPTSAINFSRAAHEKLMAVNYGGVLNCLDVVLADFTRRCSGQVAIVSSVAGYRGLPGAGGYGATKAALINLCESMREELDREGVDLRLINPGFVATPLTEKNDFPMPFLISAEKAASYIVRGLDRSLFEIAFPRRFVWLMKLLRFLPDGVFFSISRRMLRNR